MLDWAFIGLYNGDIMAFDLDRGSLARSFRIPNFWKEKNPGATTPNLITMSLHPRDVGKLLLGYTHGAVVYSMLFQQALREATVQLLRRFESLDLHMHSGTPLVHSS
ncbi:hypothetical protein LB505_000382 [Fusarium chuoi]|nr:hypothetical protein LB505_000382 [Fusarium chuoi]